MQGNKRKANAAQIQDLQKRKSEALGEIVFYLIIIIITMLLVSVYGSVSSAPLFGFGLTIWILYSIPNARDLYWIYKNLKDPEVFFYNAEATKCKVHRRFWRKERPGYILHFKEPIAEYSKKRLDFTYDKSIKIGDRISDKLKQQPTVPLRVSFWKYGGFYAEVSM
ncbi:MAG: hypothetical protein JJT94_00735 [Bernardetiaceae bacterium]|nr:hypothetical protein [Bernardetiaceae bacterium]